MDNETKNSTETSPFETLFSNKELMSRLSEIAKDLKTSMKDSPDALPSEDASPSAEATTVPFPASSSDALSTALSNPELLAKLPEVVAALSSVSGTGTSKKGPSDKRTALLLALRPYLSPSRCEAIDYITRIGKLGDLIKNLNL